MLKRSRTIAPSGHLFLSKRHESTTYNGAEGLSPTIEQVNETLVDLSPDSSPRMRTSSAHGRLANPKPGSGASPGLKPASDEQVDVMKLNMFNIRL